MDKTLKVDRDPLVKFLEEVRDYIMLSRKMTAPPDIEEQASAYLNAITASTEALQQNLMDNNR